MMPLEFDLFTWTVAFCVAMVAGLVKGIVGFALPMIFISGLSIVMPPETALGALIIPAFIANGLQALRHGFALALATVKQFRMFLISGGVCLMASAQFVLMLSPEMLFLLLGFPVTFFAFWQLIKIDVFQVERSREKDILMGGIAGLIGGVSGIWGPPTVMYLTAIALPKVDKIRIQGVIYGLGAVALIVAHLGSGVLHSQVLTVSALLVAPTLLGFWGGDKFQGHINQATFRRLTLCILLVAGLNLLRRGMGG